MRVSVVGSGPNGLAAAVIMARAGHEVVVYETASTAGGGLQSAAFAGAAGVLDVGAAVHPMSVSSLFFRSFGLRERMQFHVPEISFAHALQGRSAVAYRELDRTVAELDAAGGRAWRNSMQPLVARIDEVRAMSGLVPRLSWTQLVGAVDLAWSAAVKFPLLRGTARALASGAVAHGAGPMSSISSRFIGAVLAAEAHAEGWPIPVGGSSRIAATMIDDLKLHGGRVELEREVADIRDVWRPGEVAIFDTSPRTYSRVAESLLPARYRRALGRYRYGNAVSKVDYVLNGPIPWIDSRLQGAGTVHIGGSASEVSRAERSAARGEVPSKAFVLLSQPTRFDRTRLPSGSTSEIVWAYAHVPNGTTTDHEQLVTRRIEEFAPGFRDLIQHAESRPAAWYAQHNANFVGGDVLGGKVSVAQFLTRPVKQLSPWRTPLRGVYLCSSATPPGAGVHGMGGWHAARLALRDMCDEAMPDLGPLTSKVQS